MSSGQLSKKPAIFLMGPTASGKTDLAVELRKHLPVELISVDSALIYRGMDIGTAKPTTEILAKVPHHLIDICDPADAYTVADFAREARQHMDDITANHRIPVLVGGTMLYFRALLDGLAEIPAIPPQVRQDIENRAMEDGWPAMHELLEKVDPETAVAIHPNHSRRIQRALEVYNATGKPMSAFRRRQAQGDSAIKAVSDNYRIVQIALLPNDRHQLHRSIATRFKAMLEAGFEQEVRELFLRGDLDETLPSIRAVGYQQMWQYLAGKSDYEQMAEKAIAATRQLAKRQFTWLRKWDELYSLPVDKSQGNTKIMQQLVVNTLKILSKEHI